jgi:hypothetical protein
MRSMRRLIAVLMLVVSLSVTMGVLPYPQTAEAARFLSEDPCVEIGLPVVPVPGTTCTAKDGNPGIKNDPKTGGAIVSYLKGWLALLGGAVGLLVILMIVISGIQYITSIGDPGSIKSAKSRLQNAIIALVLYLSMYAILNFLVPGGIL